MWKEIRQLMPGILALVLSLVLFFNGSFFSVENWLTDLRFIWLQHNVSGDVVIVEIDSRSIKEISTWPWSRSYHADLISRLSQAGVNQVFFDVDFSSASLDSEADQELYDSVASATKEGMRVVLPSFWQPISLDNRNQYVLTEPPDQLTRYAETGMVNVIPSSDGLARELIHIQQGLSENYLSVAARITTKEGLKPDTFYPIDFSYRPFSFKKISYVDVLSVTADLSFLKGKTVYVGSTAIELSDNLAVPIYRSIPGVVFQALAYETLNAKPLTYGSKWLSVVACVLIFFLWPLLARTSWRHLGVILLATGLTSIVVSVYLQAIHGVLIELVPLNFCLFVSCLLSLLTTLDKQALQILVERLKAMRQGALLSSMLEASSDSIIVLNAEGVITSANPAARDLFSYRADLVNSPVTSILSHLSNSKALGDMAKFCKKEGCVELDSGTDGKRIPIELSLSEININGETVYSAIIRDITEKKNQRELLRYQATHDPLTDLPNRTMLAQNLAELTLEQQAVLFVLDLDRFKEINDTVGHSTGDDLLVTIANKLRKALPTEFSIARIGGDEFAVLAITPMKESEIIEITDTMLIAIRTPIEVMGIFIEVGVSIGVVCYPEHAEDRDALLRLAEIAMYAAKKEKTGYQLYDMHKESNGLRKLEVAAALRPALENDELELYYQPKISLVDGSIIGFEALSRWNDKTLGFVSPLEFVEIAEETDLIGPFTWWGIYRAIRDIKNWREHQFTSQISLNLSARHLNDTDFFWKFMRALKEADIPSTMIQLEITESSLMSDPTKAIEITSKLYEAGISIAVDDYGTGFSSLAYLKNLKVDTLKIDRCFVTNIHKSSEDQHIVRSTISMAHGLGIKVVAEGVEEVEELRVLESYGCDSVQGYYFSKPMPEKDVIQWAYESCGISGNTNKGVSQG